MPKEYPVETIIKAHALFMDYVSIADIERLLKASGEDPPTRTTISGWAKTGAATQGVPWQYWRDVCEKKRATVDYQRGVELMEREGYDDFAQRTLGELRQVQQEIIDGIKGGEIALKSSDLKDIIKTQVLLHGRATSRIEMQMSVYQAVGAIVGARARQIFLDDPRIQQFLYLVAEDLDTAQLTSGSRNADSHTEIEFVE